MTNNPMTMLEYSYGMRLVYRYVLGTVRVC